MLTRLFDWHAPGAAAEVRARRLALAPRVGEALQLTNILLDWPGDVRRGRCYVPAAWLAELSLRPADLVAARPDAAVRLIADRLERLARSALAEVPDYLDLIPARYLRYRLFCLWPALWASDSLDHARRDPEFPWGPRRPRLPRTELWGAAGASLIGLRGAGALRERRLVGPVIPASPSSAR
jgi:farnesyl-diphosphate farnesyltransferase